MEFGDILAVCDRKQSSVRRKLLQQKSWENTSDILELHTLLDSQVITEKVSPEALILKNGKDERKRELKFSGIRERKLRDSDRSD